VLNLFAAKSRVITAHNRRIVFLAPALLEANLYINRTCGALYPRIYLAWLLFLMVVTAPNAISGAVNAAEEDLPNKTSIPTGTPKVVSNQTDWTLIGPAKWSRALSLFIFRPYQSMVRSGKSTITLQMQ